MTAPAVSEYRIDLPLTKPLNLNDREHWAVRNNRVQALRRAVKLLCRTKQIPVCSRIQTELHYTPRDSRRRDSLNLVATLKACEDGIVDAGIVPDDTPDYVVSVMPIIDPPVRARHGSLYLIVRPLEAAA
jgi:crossover junction endodeoxyribonuclease RusA